MKKALVITSVLLLVVVSLVSSIICFNTGYDGGYDSGHSDEYWDGYLFGHEKGYERGFYDGGRPSRLSLLIKYGIPYVLPEDETGWEWLQEPPSYISHPDSRWAFRPATSFNPICEGEYYADIWLGGEEGWWWSQRIYAPLELTESWRSESGWFR